MLLVLITGGGQIKKFDTIEEMNQDENPQEGDLAVVYSNQQSNMTENSVFSKITLPETVVLNEAIEDSIQIGFKATDTSIDMDSWGDLNSSFLDLGIDLDMGQINYHIVYESEDGLTYVRTEDSISELDLNFNIQFGNRYGEEFQWDDRIGQFFIIEQKIFSGLFEYGYHKNKNQLYMLDPLEIYLDSEEYKYSLNYSNLSISAEKLSRIIDNSTIKNYDHVSGGYNFNYNLMEIDNNFYLCKFDNSTPCILIFPEDDRDKRIYPSDRFICIYEIDFENETTNEISIESLVYETKTITHENLSYNVRDYGISRFLSFRYDASEDYEIIPIPQTQLFYKKDSDNYWYTQYVLKNYDGFEHRNFYNYASTQLTTEAKDVYRGQFYGSNGLEEGSLGIPNNSFLDLPAEVFVNIWDNYNKMNPIVITDDNRMDFINKNSEILLIPTKYDGTPLIDTSNLVNANILFRNFRKLKYIPQLDFSNATTGHSIFSGCINLESVMITNIYGITILSEMFNGCTNLRNILLFNTSNITNFSSMFQNCSSLVTAPQFNTSSAFSIGSMFNLCTNLINVPFFDLSAISNANNLKNMFGSCPNLSNESLNNILASLTSTSISGTDGKTLKNAGLSQEQAQICKTLSNYTAFTAAGWTTGY